MFVYSIDSHFLMRNSTDFFQYISSLRPEGGSGSGTLSLGVLLSVVGLNLFASQLLKQSNTRLASSSLTPVRSNMAADGWQVCVLGALKLLNIHHKSSESRLNS